MFHPRLLLLVAILAILSHHQATALSNVNPPKANNGKVEANGASAPKIRKPFGGGGGGRKPGRQDMPSIKDEEDAPDEIRWEPTKPKPSEARLTVVQITDVYTLEHFASLKTMLQETRDKLKSYRQEMGAADSDADTEELPQTLTKSDTGVISMLTGDFLAPYLLSSVDRGKGMMKALGETPIDYLCWVSKKVGVLGRHLIC